MLELKPSHRNKKREIAIAAGAVSLYALWQLAHIDGTCSVQRSFTGGESQISLSPDDYASLPHTFDIVGFNGLNEIICTRSRQVSVLGIEVGTDSAGLPKLLPIIFIPRRI